METRKKNNQMHHGHVYKLEPFGFVLRVIGFVYAFYAAIVNKTTSEIFVNKM